LRLAGGVIANNCTSLRLCEVVYLHHRRCALHVACNKLLIFYSICHDVDGEAYPSPRPADLGLGFENTKFPNHFLPQPTSFPSTHSKCLSPQPPLSSSSDTMITKISTLDGNTSKFSLCTGIRGIRGHWQVNICAYIHMNSVTKSFRAFLPFLLIRNSQ
jgi:hypothetical protein